MRPSALLLLPVAGVRVHAAPNMNGFPYEISNPHANGKWTGEYSTMAGPALEYFDVYSPPITTRYAQVFWTMLAEVPLPADVVARFANSTMAVRGYECNQVMRSASGDIPVPISASYNHHHTAYLKSSHAALRRLPATARDAMFSHGAGEVWKAVDTRPPALRTGPPSVALHEGNGGEFRQSFHGFPLGFAQFVQSPTSFQLQPMQIDTWNRDNNYTTAPAPFNMTARPRGQFVPAAQPARSWAPRSGPDAVYSGLLECPCTDRITKVVDGSAAAVKAEGTCGAPAQIADAQSCYQEATASLAPLAAFGMKVAPEVQAVDSAELPPGCFTTVHAAPGDPATPMHKPSNATVYFNARASSAAACGAATAAATTLWGGSKRGALDDLGLNVELNATTLLLTLSGPSDVWHGIGFNSTKMVDGTYAIVVDGSTGNVSEHRLGTQAPGTALPRTAGLTVFAQRVAGGRRSTFVGVPMAALAAQGLSFAAARQAASLPIITAIGSGPAFAYHKSKSSHELALFTLASPSCLCRGAGSDAPFGQGTGQLVYTPVAGEPGGSGSDVPGAGPSSLHFAKHCLPYPGGTMLLGKNPSCDLRSYVGGQSCCHHLFTLLDRDQVTPWQDQPLVFHHKWRIWYQEAEASPTPLTDLTQFNWGGMASPTEYDVPKCADGVYGCSRTADGGWVHSHNGTWTVADMKASAAPANATGISFKVIHGHCHAPTCVEFSLWNHDDGTLICRQRPSFGTSNRTFDEEGYLHVPPCVFGSPEEGLNPAFRLPFNTTLFGTKTCQADYGHHGEMSLWQTYGDFY
jgi:hypothetical protein